MTTHDERTDAGRTAPGTGDRSTGRAVAVSAGTVTDRPRTQAGATIATEMTDE